jgi:hypothetical protein
MVIIIIIMQTAPRAAVGGVEGSVRAATWVCMALTSPQL